MNGICSGLHPAWFRRVSARTTTHDGDRSLADQMTANKSRSVNGPVRSDGQTDHERRTTSSQSSDTPSDMNRRGGIYNDHVTASRPRAAATSRRHDDGRRHDEPSSSSKGTSEPSNHPVCHCLVLCVFVSVPFSVFP